MVIQGFSAATVAGEIATKLASRSRHVCLFLGAGASCSAGLPNVAGLKDAVLVSVPDDDAGPIRSLLEGRNLEEGLSHLRQVRGILEGSEKTFDGLDSASAERLDQVICSAVILALDDSHADLTPFNTLGAWLGSVDYERPVELFTVNYDLLLERGLEHAAGAYFDGFVGSVEARFRSDLVEPLDSASGDRLPASFVRLWKLHGSCNWVQRMVNGRQEVVRIGSAPRDAATVAIFPSERKYSESRRVPFVVLMDRLRRALAETETVTVVSGYSFGDQHLNETLFDAARHHLRSEMIALCHDSIPDVLASVAGEVRNLTVLSPSEAIVGGRRGRWNEEDASPGVFEDGAFLLGDFAGLAQFLLGTPPAENAE